MNQQREDRKSSHTQIPEYSVKKKARTGRAEGEKRESREGDEGGQRKSRGRQDHGMWREERSDDVAVDACCETKSVHGKLDLCIFNTFLCSAQLVASLLLNEIL